MPKQVMEQVSDVTEWSTFQKAVISRKRLFTAVQAIPVSQSSIPVQYVVRSTDSRQPFIRLHEQSRTCSSSRCRGQRSSLFRSCQHSTVHNSSLFAADIGMLRRSYLLHHVCMRVWCSPLLCRTNSLVWQCLWRALFHLLQLLLPDCIRFSLLLPDCVCFSCCSPTVYSSAAVPQVRPLDIMHIQYKV